MRPMAALGFPVNPFVPVLKVCPPAHFCIWNGVQVKGGLLESGKAAPDETLYQTDIQGLYVQGKFVEHHFSLSPCDIGGTHFGNFRMRFKNDERGHKIGDIPVDIRVGMVQRQFDMSFARYTGHIDDVHILDTQFLLLPEEVENFLHNFKNKPESQVLDWRVMSAEPLKKAIRERLLVPARAGSANEDCFILVYPYENSNFVRGYFKTDEISLEVTSTPDPMTKGKTQIFGLEGKLGTYRFFEMHKAFNLLSSKH